MVWISAASAYLGVISKRSRLVDHEMLTHKYPAPTANLTSLIGTVKPVGAPFNDGS